MTTAKEIEALRKIVREYGIGWSVEKLVSNIYRELKALGIDATIVNGRYIEISGQQYCFIKSRKNYRWYVR